MSSSSSPSPSPTAAKVVGLVILLGAAVFFGRSGLVWFGVVSEEEATQGSGWGSWTTAVVLGTPGAGCTNAAEVLVGNHVIP